MAVSHPTSADYGKHWTGDEVADAFAPSAETVDKVLQWLTSSGIATERILHTSGSLTVGVTVDEAEHLLKTEYHGFQHASTGHKQAACDQYHIPGSLKDHIDFITPGVALLAPASAPKATRGLSRRAESQAWAKPNVKEMPSWFHHHANASDLSHCDQVITPACIKALYHVPPATKADPSNSMGIFENGDFYAQEDLNLFFANYTPYIPNGTHPTLDSIDGGSAPVTNLSEAGGESSLDLQLAYPLIYPQRITLFQTDDINYSTGNITISSSGGYNTWLDAIDGSYCSYTAYGETGDSPIDPTYPDPLPGGYNGQLQCGVYKPTNVMSVSYSRQEWDHPVNYQKRQCNEFMKLALQGHTIFFSSGDTGVAGRATDPSPNGCLGTNNTIFNPRWPDSCPYLTVVGGTKVYPGHTVFEPESVANDLAGDPYTSAYSSGGGFSNIYSIPDYQTNAVATYFAEHDPGYPYYSGNQSLGANGGLYNRSGRGYPDVSANGDNIAVYVGGEATLEGGTSASTPIFASIVNRINEERIAIGKGPVGFINPVLYSHPEVLNDIVNGSNPGCGTNGFTAVKG
ncbi:hypothetical protein LTR36_010993 [Oleoguttula mirabilis]|uniref:Peptidase S53 domain-containing protein n=1 Tax=Oleoguttula mirabilis TaxID=1507867 RepID=A0AAV9J392_9PEZI|nr:hypothetical protein LTR36_010993 [Oleoguttula mirabilis]